MTFNPDDLFKPENEVKVGFFKFEKPGDRVGGKLIGVVDKEAQGEFGPQKVFTLEQPDGTTIKVGIPLSKEFTLAGVQRAVAGDYVGFLFEKEIPSQTKGFAAAKSIKPFWVQAEKTLSNDSSV